MGVQSSAVPVIAAAAAAVLPGFAQEGNRNRVSVNSCSQSVAQANAETQLLTLKLLFLPGKMLHEMTSLVTEEPKYWLDVTAIWRNIHGREGEKKTMSLQKTHRLSRENQKKRQIAQRKGRKQKKGERPCLRDVRRKLERGGWYQRERALRSASLKARLP